MACSTSWPAAAAGRVRGVTAAVDFDDAKARSNAGVLAVAQALYGAVTTALVVTAGLVGSQLSPDPSLGHAADVDDDHRHRHDDISRSR